jgi:hypothetical protein
VVTEITGHLNDRSKNFTHPECEKHFYPTESISSTEIDYALAALDVYNFSAFLLICAFLFALSIMVLFVEILFSHITHRQILDNNSMIPLPKRIHFSYKIKCANHTSAIEKFNQLQNRLLIERGVVILRADAQTDVCDEKFEISISLVLQLNASDQEPAVGNELQSFIFYLNAISIF